MPARRADDFEQGMTGFQPFRTVAYVLQLIFAASVAAASVNCTDSGEAQRNQATEQTQFELELQLARTAVAEKAYAEGRLGPPERVLADIGQSVQYAIGVGAEADPQFVTPDGRLVPFREQSTSQQTAFL